MRCKCVLRLRTGRYVFPVLLGELPTILSGVSHACCREP
jgi:hypothetical protein